MSEILKGEHGPESGHQTVEELIAKNETAVAERQATIEGLQGQIEGLQGQIEGLQGQIAEVTEKVSAEQREIRKLKNEIEEPKRYQVRLVEFVNKLRQQDAGGWGFSSVVNGLFNPDQPPVLIGSLERSLTPEMKQEIIQSVLAETGLTEQEGQELVEKQAEANRIKRGKKERGVRFHG